MLGKTARVVRGIYFDKHENANWKVAWHQDLTIAVRERVEVDGYGAWSIKARIHHVQPPVTVLENMLTVRVHLDHTEESNGALRVLPGRHIKLLRGIEIIFDQVARAFRFGVLEISVGAGLITVIVITVLIRVNNHLPTPTEVYRLAPVDIRN